MGADTDQPDLSGSNIEPIKQLLGEYLDKYKSSDIDALADNAENTSIYVDVRELKEFNPTLYQMFREAPEKISNIANVVLQNDITVSHGDLSNANVRFSNGQRHVAVSDLSKTAVGGFVQTIGVVTNVGEVQQVVEAAVMTCPQCGDNTVSPQPYLEQVDDLKHPNVCDKCGHEGEFDFDTQTSGYTTVQHIEVAEKGPLYIGEQSTVVEAVLDTDLTGSVSTGDSVAVNGVLHNVVSGDDTTAQRQILNVSSVAQIDMYDSDSQDKSPDEIGEFADSDSPWKPVVESIIPSVYGKTNIKLSAALQLFSGVGKHMPDGYVERGEIQVLLTSAQSGVADDLANALHRIYPRKVSTLSADASSIGSPNGQQNTRPIGEYARTQFIKSNQGIIVVQDFDELTPVEHDFIESAISIGSPYIDSDMRELNIQTSVIGVIEEDMRSVVEHDGTPSSLVKQFDLVIPCSDTRRADEVEFNLNTDRMGALDIDGGVEDAAIEQLAAERQKAITNQELRAYIGFARSSVQPTLSTKSVESVEQFYTTLISEIGEEDAHAVIPAGVSALARLVEASARMRLSDTVERKDVELVASLIYSICQKNMLDIDIDAFEVDVKLDDRGLVAL